MTSLRPRDRCRFCAARSRPAVNFRTSSAPSPVRPLPYAVRTFSLRVAPRRARRTDAERISLAVAEHHGSRPGIACTAARAPRPSCARRGCPPREFDSKTSARGRSALRYLKAVVENPGRPRAPPRGWRVSTAGTDEQILGRSPSVPRALHSHGERRRRRAVDGSVEDTRPSEPHKVRAMVPPMQVAAGPRTRAAQHPQRQRQRASCCCPFYHEAVELIGGAGTAPSSACSSTAARAALGQIAEACPSCRTACSRE